MRFQCKQRLEYTSYCHVLDILEQDKANARLRMPEHERIEQLSKDDVTDDIRLIRIFDQHADKQTNLIAHSAILQLCRNTRIPLHVIESAYTKAISSGSQPSCTSKFGT